MKITDFLMERYAEECADAEALLGVYDELIATIQTSRITMYALAPHFARWDPARVMAECEAKRRIVALEQEWLTEMETILGKLPGMRATSLTLTLALLALPYATHPDYQEEWRP